MMCPCGGAAIQAKSADRQAGACRCFKGFRAKATRERGGKRPGFRSPLRVLAEKPGVEARAESVTGSAGFASLELGEGVDLVHGLGFRLSAPAGRAASFTSRLSLSSRPCEIHRYDSAASED